MNREADIDAIATWERGYDDYITRSRDREPDAVCYTCGAPVPDSPRFGDEATCDSCARSARRVDPWLANREGQ